MVANVCVCVCEQSFILATLPYTLVLPPVLLTFVLRPLTLGYANYLPSGPTALLFALLANYYAAIPYTYKYRISPSTPTTSSSTSTSTTASQATSIWARSITITSKATSYLPPAQLALSQFPGSLLAAAVGWAVGTAYRRELLPGAASWRVPGWMVGEDGAGDKGAFDSLRQRLESERGEGSGGVSSGILAGETGTARQRRTLGEMIGGQFGSGS
jgi:hypothetical protein